MVNLKYAEVTDNKILRLRYCTVEANYREARSMARGYAYAKIKRIIVRTYTLTHSILNRKLCNK